MTYSIVIYQDEMWGVRVSSKYLAVGAFVPWLRAEVDAIATQALVNLN